ACSERRPQERNTLWTRRRSPSGRDRPLGIAVLTPRLPASKFCRLLVALGQLGRASKRLISRHGRAICAPGATQFQGICVCFKGGGYCSPPQRGGRGATQRGEPPAARSAGLNKALTGPPQPGPALSGRMQAATLVAMLPAGGGALSLQIAPP